MGEQVKQINRRIVPKQALPKATKVTGRALLKIYRDREITVIEVRKIKFKQTTLTFSYLYIFYPVPVYILPE